MTRRLIFALALLAVSFPAMAEEPAAQEAEKPKNTLKWSTASEVDNFGFDVYRGDSEEGPFKRLNAEPIPGHGTIDEPSYYQYVDDTIDPEKTYWYYVESISTAGERERFTPVFKTGPKTAPKQGEAREKGEGSGEDD